MSIIEEKNTFLFVILLKTQKWNFFEETFESKISPPFFVGRPEFASRTRWNQEKCYIDYVPNSFNLTICKNLTVIEEFGNEYQYFRLCFNQFLALRWYGGLLIGQNRTKIGSKRGPKHKITYYEAKWDFKVSKMHS